MFTQFKNFIFVLGACLSASAFSLPKMNGSRVTVDGKITEAKPSYFRMSYGKNDKKSIMVEMDDWDSYQEGRLLKKGDRVTVYGEIDNDFLEKRKIEASSVYVKDLNTFFYANSADEEDVPFTRFVILPGDGYWVTLSGTVKDISDEKFQMDMGFRTIDVDTSDLGYNPFDDKGYQKVSKGDFVQVSGLIDDELFSKRKVDARFLVTLLKASNDGHKTMK